MELRSDWVPVGRLAVRDAEVRVARTESAAYARLRSELDAADADRWLAYRTSWHGIPRQEFDEYRLRVLGDFPRRPKMVRRAICFCSICRP